MKIQLTAANQTVLADWKARLTKALASEGKRTTATDKNVELAERLAREIKTLEENADPENLKEVSSIGEKRAQLSIVSRRMENGEAEEVDFIRGGKLRGVVSELEEPLRGIVLIHYEQQLAEVTAAFRPYFSDEPEARSAARQTPLVRAWEGWFRNVSTCCALAGRGEVESLHQSITAILEGLLPFNFDNGLRAAAKTPATD